MLRKKGKATQHNRKTKQHNTTRPRQYFSKKKAASGGTRTHDRLLARRRSISLLYMLMLCYVFMCFSLSVVVLEVFGVLALFSKFYIGVYYTYDCSCRDGTDMSI